MTRNNKRSKQCYIFVLIYLVGLGLIYQYHQNIAFGYLNFIFFKIYCNRKHTKRCINTLQGILFLSLLFQIMYRYVSSKLVIKLKCFNQSTSPICAIEI